MENTSKTKNISSMDKILNKIKKLEVDKVYSVLKITNNIDANRVYISRLADSGYIIKSSRGYFYKPLNRVPYRKSDKIIPLNKKIFSNDLFWSVGDGYEIDSDELIKAYLVDWCEDDLMALYSLFGYKRIIKDSLKLYKHRGDPNYKKIRIILERFDKWRLDDKRYI